MPPSRPAIRGSPCGESGCGESGWAPPLGVDTDATAGTATADTATAGGRRFIRATGPPASLGQWCATPRASTGPRLPDCGVTDQRAGCTAVAPLPQRSGHSGQQAVCSPLGGCPERRQDPHGSWLTKSQFRRRHAKGQRSKCERLWAAAPRPLSPPLQAQARLLQEQDGVPVPLIKRQALESELAEVKKGLELSELARAAAEAELAAHREQSDAAWRKMQRRCDELQVRLRKREEQIRLQSKAQPRGKCSAGGDKGRRTLPRDQRGSGSDKRRAVATQAASVQDLEEKELPLGVLRTGSSAEASSSARVPAVAEPTALQADAAALGVFAQYAEMLARSEQASRSAIDAEAASAYRALRLEDIANVGQRRALGAEVQLLLRAEIAGRGLTEAAESEARLELTRSTPGGLAVYADYQEKPTGCTGMLWESVPLSSYWRKAVAEDMQQHEHLSDEFIATAMHVAEQEVSAAASLRAKQVGIAQALCHGEVLEGRLRQQIAAEEEMERADITAYLDEQLTRHSVVCSTEGKRWKRLMGLPHVAKKKLTALLQSDGLAGASIDEGREIALAAGAGRHRGPPTERAGITMLFVALKDKQADGILVARTFADIDEADAVAVGKELGLLTASGEERLDACWPKELAQLPFAERIRRAVLISGVASRRSTRGLGQHMHEEMWRYLPPCVTHSILQPATRPGVPGRLLSYDGKSDTECTVTNPALLSVYQHRWGYKVLLRDEREQTPRCPLVSNLTTPDAVQEQAGRYRDPAADPEEVQDRVDDALRQVVWEVEEKTEVTAGCTEHPMVMLGRRP
eukprot:TRINITY_DN28491_c0_g1_i3.p1 TRINITY_DN28491_c0_g1~~TRINITY_DN28491_c0_g1_i3.p1  ORF type:complete len:805 (+),score=198.10 TRINITY_DN28491_c0_g1_i3:79-2493(+)